MAASLFCPPQPQPERHPPYASQVSQQQSSIDSHLTPVVAVVTHQIADQKQPLHQRGDR